MKRAIEIAKDSGEDCPVGCIIVQNGIEIASSCNKVEALCDPTAHAEMVCIKAACNKLRSRHLPDCTLYCTLEPCKMCSEAIRLAQIGSVVFGAFRDKSISYSQNTVGGIMERECSDLLTKFFNKLRLDARG